ncbi:hypothetical protein LV75_003818 [Actinokineospora diospyrosa]|uniref:Zinc ribbon domain-containing protein n=1 Tax=Actinokineospora diospyrosa TaxID=103728 RepID=A0ABT1IFA4_9PSEU|nr:hypothetical protein [Actinokineospora diospyrosa]
MSQYRYLCGECGFHTSWTTESAGAAQQEQHYTQQHPGIVPGGTVTVREGGGGGGGGCLGLVGICFFLLLGASTCRGQARSMPEPVSIVWQVGR